MSCQSAIELLREIVESPDCAQMNRSTVKGFLGELLVKKRLEDEGVVVRHLGNQNGFDLQFTVGGNEIRADVKMSVPKDEFKWGVEYWGWALVHENKKKNLRASHFICVGCSAKLDIERLFVVPSSKVEECPRGIRQFSKVKHDLILPRGSASSATFSESDADFLAKCERLKTAGTIVEVTSGQRLSDAFV